MPLSKNIQEHMQKKALTSISLKGLQAISEVFELQHPPVKANIQNFKNQGTVKNWPTYQSYSKRALTTLPGGH